MQPFGHQISHKWMDALGVAAVVIRLGGGSPQTAHLRSSVVPKSAGMMSVFWRVRDSSVQQQQPCAQLSGVPWR